MDPFHQRLARTGLAACRRYGFALAGGYAVQAAGLVQRPSEDIDLFTAWDRRKEFTTAVAAIVAAYRDDGLTVDTDRQYDTFARLTVTGGPNASKVELGVDWRANEPILMAIGPVLHPDDAVANKMSALYGRAFARDFIDIDATLQSGRYTHQALLDLAQRADPGFDRRLFADALSQASALDPDDFAPYGVTGQQLTNLRNRFAAWRRELLNNTDDHRPADTSTSPSGAQVAHAPTPSDAIDSTESSTSIHRRLDQHGRGYRHPQGR